ncbi:MAG: glycine cleavage system aminomethyltransferase GcvT [Candidatus Omnitrophota bacterium]
MESLKTTPLSEEHIALGAKMAPFAGWQMPIQYEGILAETLYTRKAVTCFDISHMGEFLIKGDAKKSGLETIVAAQLDSLSIGACRYTSMLNEQGGIIDDLIVYRKAQEEWMIVVNAGTIEKDKAHFLKHLSKNADFTDISAKIGKIDLQGPKARDIIKIIAPEAEHLQYYSFISTDVLGEKNIVSRTGYTGELGFEIYSSAQHIKAIWKTLLTQPDVKPAGLGSRDVLRLEMGYSLYGQDIDETTTPLEAGLEKFINFNKEFIGKEALLKQKKNGLQKKRVFLKTTTRRAPRHLHNIYAKDSRIGSVTSGSFSPHLELGIGMGFIEKSIDTSEVICVGENKARIEANFCEKPFIKQTSLKN